MTTLSGDCRVFTTTCNKESGKKADRKGKEAIMYQQKDQNCDRKESMPGLC